MAVAFSDSDNLRGKNNSDCVRIFSAFNSEYARNEFDLCEFGGDCTSVRSLYKHIDFCTFNAVRTRNCLCRAWVE
jgi:hypothetical protein